MMSDATRYVDAHSYDVFTENDGQEIMVTQLVPASVGEAFDAWMEHAWKGGMVEELRPGVGRGQVGHIRKVPLGITEEILSAGLPRENAECSDEIPSVLYKLRTFGVFPLKDHIGWVRFIPDATTPRASTLVVWTVKITPTTAGNVCLCGGSVMRVIMRAAFKVFLKTVESQLKKKLHLR